MNKRHYKKQCHALFEKAKKLNVKLEFSPETFDCHKLDCLWYNGKIALVKVSETIAIELIVAGDVRATLTDKNGNIITTVDDKYNRGAFDDEMQTYLKTDKQLYVAIDNGKLTLDYNNWIEYNGIIKKDISDEQGIFIDLGMIYGNILDNNILTAIEQVLDSIEVIKTEIKDIAEIEYDIKISNLQMEDKN